MKLLIGCIAGLLAAGPAAAERYYLATMTSQGIFVRVDSITTNPRAAELLIVKDSVLGLAFAWQRQEEFDCEAHRFRIVSSKAYVYSEAEGTLSTKALDTTLLNAWETVGPDSIGRDIEEFVCGWPQKQRADETVDDKGDLAQFVGYVAARVQ